jgi:CRP-like cAMP-binding protein
MSDLKTGKRPVQQQIKTLQRGEVLFEEGTLGRELYIIQEGKVGIYKDTPDGQVELAVVEHGSTIGEMSLLDNLPRSATVKSLELTKVLVINQGTFQSVMQTVPMWLQSIIKIIVSRLRDANKRVDQAALRDKDRGIVSLLLLLYMPYKIEINSKMALDYELIMLESFFVCRLRKKDIKTILDNLEKRGLVEVRDYVEQKKKFLFIKDVEIIELYQEYLALKGQKKSFKELAIPDDVIGVLSNIAYVAQKAGQETDDGTLLLKSILFKDLSGKDNSKLEKNLLDLRRRNLITMFPRGDDFEIVFRKESITRIKKIKDWLPKFEMELA